MARSSPLDHLPRIPDACPATPFSKRPQPGVLQRASRFFRKALAHGTRALQRPLNKRLLTLSFEEDSIHMVAFRGSEVKRWGSLPLPPGLVRDGVITAPSELAILLRTFLEQQRIRPRRLVCSVSSFHSLSHIITLPPLPASAIPEAVSREVARVMPVAPETAYLFWQALGRDQGEQRFLVLATPRNILDSLVRSLQEANAIPQAMELKALALAGILSQKQAIAVDIQARSVEVAIAVEGVPASFRTVSREGETGEGLKKVAEEISRTIGFFNSSHPQEALQSEAPLFLTGPLAQDQAAAKELAALIPYPPQPLKVPLRCPEGFDPGEYAVNMGLALGALFQTKPSSFARVSLNLIPPIFRPQHRLLKATLVSAAVLAALALGFPLYQLSRQTALENDRTQAVWYRLNEELTSRKWALEKAALLESAVKEAQSQAQSLEEERQTILARGTGYRRSLSLVYDSLPPGLRLESVFRASGQMGIDGKATSYEALVKYLSSLEESGRFSEVRLNNIAGSNTSEAELAFTLELTERQDRP